MRKQVKQWQIGGTKSKDGGKVEWRQTRWQQVEDLHKASGLDLYKPQGALAEGQWGLGKLSIPRSGPDGGQ